MNLRRCPYCDARVVYSEGSGHLYQRDYGPVWECRPCKAFVGCHKSSKKPMKAPLGVVANKKDRGLRKRVHSLFDPLWRRKAKACGLSNSKARKLAYQWLAGELGKEVSDTHVGWMLEDELVRVIELCTPFQL